MANYSGQVSTANDNAHSAKADHTGFDLGDGAGNSTFEMTLGANYNNSDKLTVVGLRFTNVTITQGATIDSAVITVSHDYQQLSGTYTRAFTDIYCQDSDDADAFADTAGNRPSERTRTTASVTWDITESWSGSSGSHNSPDIASVIQEVVDRPGWSSGNDLVVLVVTADDSPEFSVRDFVSYTSSNVDAASISIDYTENTPGTTQSNLLGSIF